VLHGGDGAQDGEPAERGGAFFCSTKCPKYCDALK
jgi:hypothetical protein